MSPATTTWRSPAGEDFQTPAGEVTHEATSSPLPQASQLPSRLAELDRAARGLQHAAVVLAEEVGVGAAGVLLQWHWLRRWVWELLACYCSGAG